MRITGRQLRQIIREVLEEGIQGAQRTGFGPYLFATGALPTGGDSEVDVYDEDPEDVDLGSELEEERFLAPTEAANEAAHQFRAGGPALDVDMLRLLSDSPVQYSSDLSASLGPAFERQIIELLKQARGSMVLDDVIAPGRALEYQGRFDTGDPLFGETVVVAYSISPELKRWDRQLRVVEERRTLNQILITDGIVREGKVRGPAISKIFVTQIPTSSLR
jgi:hypothetical protein